MPGLLRDLANGDEEALGELFGTIWHQGTIYEATAPAVPFLIEVLDAPDAPTAGVLALLASIARGTSYANAHANLDRPSTEDDRERERRWVRAAHDAVAAGVSAYGRLLADERSDVRAGAAHLIGLTARPEDAVASLVLQRAASEESPVVRAALVRAAGALGVADRDRVATWLADPEPVVRVVAALAATEGTLPDDVVEVLERDVPSAVDDLASLPRDEDGDESLPWVLDRLDGHPEAQALLLRTWMRHPSASVRRDAVYASLELIQSWRPMAERLVPALADRLSDEDADVRRWAASHLGSVGRASGAAVDELWALLQRKNPARSDAARSALVALCRLRDPRAASYLERLLTADKVDLSYLRAALQTVGPWADNCRSALIRLIPLAPAGNQRIWIIEAVGRLAVAAGPAAAAEVVPAIVAQCKSHPHVTTRVLGDLGPAAVSALPLLRSMLGHDNAIVRINSARALWLVGGDAADALPVLRQSMDGDRADGPWHSALSPTSGRPARSWPISSPPCSPPRTTGRRSKPQSRTGGSQQTRRRSYRS